MSVPAIASPRAETWAIAALGAVLALAFLGSRGLYETTEGRYAECGREMLEHGNVLEPTLSGRLHWSKPPLEYWAVAAGLWLLGENEAGVRLHGALFAGLTAAAVGVLAARLFGSAVGRSAALIYLTAPFPMVMAWGASADAPLALFETLAVLAFVAADRGAPRRGLALARLGGCALGSAFLAKGPPALLALVPIVLPHAPAPRHGSGRMRRRLDPIGIAAGLCVGLAWYALEAWRHPGLVHTWVAGELVRRACTHAAARNHGWAKPLLIYGPVLVLGIGPWLWTGLRALCRVLDRARARGGRPAWPGDPRVRWLLAWIGVPLVVFSLAQSRLPLYVLPLFAPLSILLARALHAEAGADTTAPAHAWARRRRGLALAGALLILVVKGVGSWWESPRDMRRLSADVDALSASAPVAPVAPGGLDANDDAATARAHVVVFDREDMHGLAFYRRGDLERATRTGDEAWADLDLAGALRALAAPTGRPTVLVARRSDADTVRAGLRAAGVAFATLQDTDWTLFARRKPE